MRSGFVGLIGLPNAGKSSLVNALVGEKVGIISKKPQTTRRRVLGVYTTTDLQVCFIDAPGFVQAESGLNHFLQKELQHVIRDSDICLVILNIDAEKSEDLVKIVELVKKASKPFAILIHKIDLDKNYKNVSRVLKLQTELRAHGVPIITTSINQKKELLRSQVFGVLQSLLPESTQPLYEEDIYTTQSTRELVAEIVREKCFEYLHQEVPYGLTVQILKYDESGQIPKIYADIIVSKENFVPMVVGQGGQMIKRIGASARIECEKVLGHKVFLQTHVKVKKDWVKNSEALREFGYVTPD